jgi:hypothetical protein
MAIGTAHHMPPNGPYSDEDTQHYSQQSILWKTFDSKRIRSASEAAAMTSFFQTSGSERTNRLLHGPNYPKIRTTGRSHLNNNQPCDV